MTEQQKKEIKRDWLRRFGYFLPSKATEEKLQEFESKYEPIPADVRWFLAACGGGGLDPMIGGIDGIKSFPRIHDKFEKETSKGNWALMADVFVLGRDGAGNPFGVEKSTGRIVLQDHNFGGLHELAPSLYDFLRKQIDEPIED